MSDWYTNALRKMGAKAYDLTLDQIDVLPVRSSGGGAGPYYTPDFDADTQLSDIPNNSDARPVAAQALDAVTWTQVGSESRLDADDETFTAFPSGDPVQLLVLIHNATGDLLCIADAGPGMPFTPAGVDVTIQWNANGIAYLKTDPANP